MGEGVCQVWGFAPCPVNTKNSDPVHVSNRSRIQEPDFGELGEVRDFHPHVGVLGVHAAEGLGQVEAQPVHPVHVDHHAVGAAGADAGAPLAGRDDQVHALLGGQVVFQHVGQDGLVRAVGNLAGDQHAELLHGNQDMVRQGVGGAVVGHPYAGDRRVDIRQDFIGGLVLPLGVGAAGGVGNGGNPGD